MSPWLSAAILAGVALVLVMGRGTGKTVNGLKTGLSDVAKRLGRIERKVDLVIAATSVKVDEPVNGESRVPRRTRGNGVERRP